MVPSRADMTHKHLKRIPPGCVFRTDCVCGGVGMRERECACARGGKGDQGKIRTI